MNRTEYKILSAYVVTTWQQEYDNLLIDTEDGTWKGERDFRTVHRLKSRVKEGMIDSDLNNHKRSKMVK